MAIETRKITLTYELPEVVCGVLEEQAARNGHSFEEEVIDYLARSQPKRPTLSPEEIARYRSSLERYVGCWSSGDPNSSDNERIDADLVREYGGGMDSYGGRDAP